jgi:hypothetical protein
MTSIKGLLVGLPCKQNEHFLDDNNFQTRLQQQKAIPQMKRALVRK